MRSVNPNQGLGTLFSTLAAMTSPGHAAITGQPFYGQVPQLRTRPDPAIFARVVGLLQTWHERRDQRHALARLDDHMLADIGLSRADVDQEMQKPFWQG
jgi:uncharacterized protein YjiS (DUF1127 family)